MPAVEILSTPRDLQFESLSFFVQAFQPLRVHGDLPDRCLAPLSGAVKLAHQLERGARGDDYLIGGCMRISDQLARILAAMPHELPSYVLSTDNTLLRPEFAPRTWSRATEYLNHAVAAVLAPDTGLFYAIDCTAPHYVRSASENLPLADVIVAPSERSLIGKLSCYYGGQAWVKSRPGAVPMPDLL